MALTVTFGLLKLNLSPTSTTLTTPSSRVTSTSLNTLSIDPLTTSTTPQLLLLLSIDLSLSTSSRNYTKNITPSIATTPVTTRLSPLGLIASIIILIMPP
jgi:hypothetical protein